MRIALVLEKADEQYIMLLKGMFQSNSVKVITVPMHTITHLRMYCNTNKIDAVFTTQVSLLKKLSNDEKATLANYEGSMFSVTRSNTISNLDLDNLDTMEVVVLRELKHIHTIPYQKFLLQRIITKITKPQNWIIPNAFSYTHLTPSNEHELWQLMDTCLFTAIDIETNPDLAVTCHGYTVVHLHGDEVQLTNFILPMDQDYSLHLFRKFNTHPCRKGLQGGQYDISYYHIYSAPPTNYIFDSINMHHCWYAEMPKDLASLSGFYVRNFRYWKDARTSGNKEELYEYCCRDTYTTAMVILEWLRNAPAWAKNNYLMEFPLAFPSHVCGMTGLAADLVEYENQKKAKKAELELLNTRLSKLLNVTNFNTNSTPQMKALLKLIGIKDATSADEKSLVAASQKHPLNALLLDQVVAIRKLRKLISSYLKESSICTDKRILNVPRLLYALLPYGTDTGRNASKESNFWVGLQIQNIPRGGGIKNIYVADEGFLIGEADYAQAESRGTGYITGDINLINKVESDLDFHKSNASDFFGVPYDKVDKPLRQLAKPVNHGANYNMGAYMLIQQMGGELEVLKAGKLLNLSPYWGAKAIATYLLAQFDKTYPRIRGDYHTYVKYIAETTRMFVGSTGWTRYTFLDPKRNKLHLNSLVAHNPQSLNAMILNKAFMKVFYNVWIPHNQNFRLCAQIHDSILFQYRKGHEYLIDMVKENMEIITKVTDIDGTTRDMFVPVDVTSGLVRWGDKE